jgi:formylglycine-generating enzyme required for sulfatase activity
MGEDRGQTVLVDSFAPNAWGLYGVHGNVWEWTQDCWNGSNFLNPGDGTARTWRACSHVLRGGSWYSHPSDLRAAKRDQSSAGLRAGIVGFRVARALTP